MASSDTTNRIDFVGKYVGKSCKIIEKLGSGTFGDVYLGADLSRRELVAVKVETKKITHSHLLYEVGIYYELDGAVGFPKLKWWSRDTESGFNVMAVELLGPSLEELLNRCSRRFTLKTVLMLGKQLLHLTEQLHAKNILHRDIKPDNLLMGRDNNSKHLLHMIDFGLSKIYCDGKSKKHIPPRQGGRSVGTPRYASFNSHLGKELSRRDDLISIGYCLLYFLKGSLPWSDVEGATKQQKVDKIKEMKLIISVEQLCSGCPPEFITFLSYCTQLGFEENPNYSFLYTLIEVSAKREKIINDYQFDWNVI